ncbi:MAG: hypothetical protein IJT23_10370 [Clostridia bacterium]|nr:hypothetical protein [Clostridia bacterium]
MPRRAVADEKEILKNFTEIMRSNSDDVKPSDKMKAAEFLAKHYAMLDKKSDDKNGNVMIVDDIPQNLDGD